MWNVLALAIQRTFLINPEFAGRVRIANGIVTLSEIRIYKVGQIARLTVRAEIKPWRTLHSLCSQA